MNEAKMVQVLSKHVGYIQKQFDGVYVFERNGSVGTIRQCLHNKSRYQVLFDSLTPEQVIEVFEAVSK